MSVFDMQLITATRKPVSNACKDREVPIASGMADGSRIGSPNFLSGITAGVADNINDGIDQTVINGDQVAEIRGKQAAKITGDRDTHILGSLKMLVDGKEEREVKSGRVTHVGNVGIAMACAQAGMDTIRINGDRYVLITRNDTRQVMGQSFITIVGGEVNNEVSQIMRSYGWMRFEYGGFDLKMCGIGSTAIQPANVDIRLLNTDFSLVKMGLSLTKGEGLGIETQLIGGDGKLGLVKLISGGICNKMDLFGS
jgi:hypothetical protein